MLKIRKFAYLSSLVILLYTQLMHLVKLMMESLNLIDTCVLRSITFMTVQRYSFIGSISGMRKFKVPVKSKPHFHQLRELL